MKWFKHETKRSASVKRLIMEHGIEGYGLYNVCLELIAGDISIDNLTFELEEDAELIAHEFKMDTIKVEKIMHRCIELGLFDLSDNGRIRCYSLAKMLDESISKNPHVKEMKKKVNDEINSGNIPEVFRRHSGYPPTRLDKNRLDKNRLDKNRLDKESGKKTTRFLVPSIEEIKEYMDEKNITSFTPEYFFDYNNARGWMLGKNKMKDWKAAVRTWSSRENQKKQPDEIDKMIEKIIERES